MFGKKKEDKKNYDFLSTPMSYGDWMGTALRKEQRDNGQFRAIIKTLEKEQEKAQEDIASLKKQNAECSKNLEKCLKEMEIMFLKEIGEATTVKQVKAVYGRFCKSILCQMAMEDIIASTTQPQKSLLKMLGYSVVKAYTTKIKRLNYVDIYKTCGSIDDDRIDNSCYAAELMWLIKRVAGKEVDATKIIEARNSGLDAYRVFLSMLSAYGIEQDSVMQGGR